MEHCESCGATDYESLHTGDQGYTACCNERVCSGRSPVRWVLAASYEDRQPVKEIDACCSAKADELVHPLGLVVAHRR